MAWFTLAVRIGDYLILTFVNEASQTTVWDNIRGFCKDVYLYTLSIHSIPDSYTTSVKQA